MECVDLKMKKENEVKPLEVKPGGTVKGTVLISSGIGNFAVAITLLFLFIIYICAIVILFMECG